MEQELDLVRKNGFEIRNMVNPSLEVMEEAVKSIGFPCVLKPIRVEDGLGVSQPDLRCFSPRLRMTNGTAARSGDRLTCLPVGSHALQRPVVTDVHAARRLLRACRLSTKLGV